MVFEVCIKDRSQGCYLLAKLLVVVEVSVVHRRERLYGMLLSSLFTRNGSFLFNCFTKLVLGCGLAEEKIFYFCSQAYNLFRNDKMVLFGRGFSLLNLLLLFRKLNALDADVVSSLQTLFVSFYVKLLLVPFFFLFLGYFLVIVLVVRPSVVIKIGSRPTCLTTFYDATIITSCRTTA